MTILTFCTAMVSSLSIFYGNNFKHIFLLLKRQVTSVGLINGKNFSKLFPVA